jgi:hypothetical protein
VPRQTWQGASVSVQRNEYATDHLVMRTTGWGTTLTCYEIGVIRDWYYEIDVLRFGYIDKITPVVIHAAKLVNQHVQLV